MPHVQDGSGASHLVCQLEEASLQAGGTASSNPGKGVEKHLQTKAEEQQDLDPPTVSQVQWPYNHSFFLGLASTGSRMISSLVLQVPAAAACARLSIKGLDLISSLPVYYVDLL
jgi:hypothetical protein